MVPACAMGAIAFFPLFFAVRRNSTNFNSDISDRNDVFTCNKLLNSPEKELSNVLRFPKIEPLAHNDGTPSDNGLPTQLVKEA
jgi:hypothetical protein